MNGEEKLRFWESKSRTNPVGASANVVREEIVDGLDRDEQRQRQFKDFSAKGRRSRIRYTEDQRARWKKTAGEKEFAAFSKKRKAELIAKRECLPKAAIETIRKAL